MHCCCICMLECCCICYPLYSITNSGLKSLWVVLWVLANFYYLYSPNILENYEITNFVFSIPIPISEIAYYLYIFLSVVLIILLFQRNTSASNTNPIQNLQIISLILSLDLFPGNFYYVANFLPLVIIFLFRFVHGGRGNDDSPFGFWIIGNCYLSFGSILSFLWWSVILPLIEYGAVITICSIYCGGILAIFKKIKFRNYSDKYKKFSNVAYYLQPTEKEIFSVIGLIALSIVSEYLVIYFHGSLPPLAEIIFTFSYGFVLDVILCYFNQYDLHKCNSSKLMFLNFSSLIFTIYSIRYLLKT